MESLWFSSASVCYVLHPVNYRKRAGKLEIIFSPDYFQLPSDRRECSVALSYLASFRCKALRQFIPRGSFFKGIISRFFFFNYRMKIKILKHLFQRILLVLAQLFFFYIVWNMSDIFCNLLKDSLYDGCNSSLGGWVLTTKLLLYKRK